MTVLKKNGQFSQVVQNGFNALLGNNRAYTHKTVGRFTRKHYSLTDVGKTVELEALERFGIQYQIKNDAPRNGKLGQYVELADDQKEKLSKIFEIYKE